MSNNVALTKVRVPGGFIRKAERFSDKEAAEQALFLNVNYDLTKKSIPGHTIHKPMVNKKAEVSKKAKPSPKKPVSKAKTAKSAKKAEELIKEEVQKEEEEVQEEKREDPEFSSAAAEDSPNDYSIIARRTKRSPLKDGEDVIDAFFKAKSEWKKNYDQWAAEHEKDLTELSTVASTVTTRSHKQRASSPKPAQTHLLKEDYNMYNQVERSQLKFTFGRSQRPLSRSVSSKDFGFLYPSLALVKTNHPGPKIAQKLPLTKQLEMRQKEKVELELERAVREYMKPVDTTECLVPKKNIPIITKPLLDQENKLSAHEEQVLRLHKVLLNNPR